MTVLAGADIRGFYAALNIDLPGWANLEAPAHCFASPEAHNRDDHSPSTSVNLERGVWCCHGCGAHGNAYHAALAVGHTPRSAVELMIEHGLIEPHTGWQGASRAERVRDINGRTSTRARLSPSSRPALTASEQDVRRWRESLAHRPSLVRRLERERGWSFAALRALDVGVEPGGRLTIPIRDHDAGLRGVLRYHAWHSHGPKMLAVRGSRLGLIPHPATEPSACVLLVEGPPDMLAARARGLPAIAVPGTQAWRPGWAKLLTGRRVTVIMDCDPPGREAAQRICTDLRGHAEVAVLDLDPRHSDGYDLTDALLDRPEDVLARIRPALLRPAIAGRTKDIERGAER